MRFFFAAFAFVTAALSFIGCSHYQLGTEGRLTFSRLYLEPVQNDVALPQVTALFSGQLREAFLRDSRVVLVNSPEEAEAILTVSLRNLDRRVATVRADDTGLARKFELTLQAVCTLRDTRSGSVLFEARPVDAMRQVFATATPSQRESDQLQAEYNAMPHLAKSLADRVAHTVLDVW
jgi:hypothetical protein